MVLFIGKDLWPYSVVENTGFSNMVNPMELQYVILIRRHMMDVSVFRISNKVKESVKTWFTSTERVAWRAMDRHLELPNHMLQLHHSTSLRSGN